MTTTYAVHTVDSAPDGSKETLRSVREALGGVPNLAAAMAESPAFVRAFFSVRAIAAEGTLTPADIQVLSMVNAVENECEWCTAFHTAMARKAGVTVATCEAVRAQTAPLDARANALRSYSRALIEHRGNPPVETVDAFFKAGFTRAQALEVILGVAFSTMANYAQHLVHAPLDGWLAEFAWTAQPG